MRVGCEQAGCGSSGQKQAGCGAGGQKQAGCGVGGQKHALAILYEECPYRRERMVCFEACCCIMCLLGSLMVFWCIAFVLYLNACLEILCPSLIFHCIIFVFLLLAVLSFYRVAAF